VRNNFSKMVAGNGWCRGGLVEHLWTRGSDTRGIVVKAGLYSPPQWQARRRQQRSQRELRGEVVVVLAETADEVSECGGGLTMRILHTVTSGGRCTPRRSRSKSNFGTLSKFDPLYKAIGVE
jgi:hypothetical protein